MPSLVLTVRWLADDPAGTSYHGDDWPPSPLRVYQALVASARRRTADPIATDAALEHLASLPPPTIFAPRPESRSPVRSAVPNNDGDKILELVAKGRAQQARRAAASQRTLRERVGWRLNAPVHYVWQASHETGQHLERLRVICAGVTAVGQGIDLAWIAVRMTEQVPRLPGLEYAPTSAGVDRLKVPYPGVLGVLDRRHREYRARVGRGAVAGLLEPVHRQVPYQSPMSLPGRRYAAFSLRTPADQPWSLAPEDGVLAAAMVRHAVHQAAQRAGLDSGRISELMGHGGDGRVQVWPVPNVGHAHADGRIRRVLLTCSTTVPEDEWTGPTGFIHQVVHDRYLKDHPEPDEIEYYLCGPPPMIAAVNQMLFDLGVEPDRIAYDEFG